MDQEKIFDIINKISQEHCHKTFGYLDENDLKNEIWVICLEKLKDFDYERGELEHFLRVSVKNRLVNRFKDITKSVRSPCPRCPFFRPKETPDCAKFGEDKSSCNKWRNYQLSIESRNSLLNASQSQVERQTGDNLVDSIAAKELKDVIGKKINKAHQHDLDQLTSGGKISKQRLKKLKKEINRVVGSDEQLVQITIGRKNA